MHPHLVDGFQPNRLPPWGRDEVEIPVEGLEATRVNDFEGLDQKKVSHLAQ